MDNVICEHRCIKKDLIIHHIFVFNIKNNFYKFFINFLYYIKKFTINYNNIAFQIFVIKFLIKFHLILKVTQGQRSLNILIQLILEGDLSHVFQFLQSYI